MMKKGRILMNGIRGWVGLVGLALVGCMGGGAKTYYVLTPDGSAPMGGGVGVGVGPVTVAEYVDRANLVVAEGANQLSVAEDHRWAGDLSSAMARVTATNLGRRLHTGRVQIYPWSGDDGIRYQVTLDVRQFHAGVDGYAVMEATWRAYALPERKLVTTRTFVDREAMRGDGFGEMVAAQSRLMARLADAIAVALH